MFYSQRMRERVLCHFGDSLNLSPMLPYSSFPEAFIELICIINRKGKEKIYLKNEKLDLYECFSSDATLFQEYNHILVYPSINIKSLGELECIVLF